MDGMAAERIDSRGDAVRLVEHLLDRARVRPVVVISTAAGQTDPYVDVRHIRDALHGLSDVCVIPTGDVSWEFSRHMPEGTQVYGGASRAYPVDPAWQEDLSRSPLRFAYGPDTHRRVGDALISDAMAMAWSAGLVTAGDVAAAPEATTVSGTVQGLAGGRGLVRLEDGWTAAIWPELTCPGVALERLLTSGMPVEGALDPVTRRLDVSGMRIPDTEALARHEPGSTALVRIRRVHRDCTEVELHPGVTVILQAFDVAGDPQADLRALLTPGEVGTASVVRRGSPSGDGWRLSMIDADDNLVVEAIPLLAGGPPWLELPPKAREAPEEGADRLDAAAMPPPPAPAGRFRGTLNEAEADEQRAGTPPEALRHDGHIPTPRDLFPSSTSGLHAPPGHASHARGARAGARNSGGFRWNGRSAVGIPTGARRSSGTTGGQGEPNRSCRADARPAADTAAGGHESGDPT